MRYESVITAHWGQDRWNGEKVGARIMLFNKIKTATKKWKTTGVTLYLILHRWRTQIKERGFLMPQYVFGGHSISNF